MGKIEEIFAPTMSVFSNPNIATLKKKKRLFLGLFAISILLVAAIVCIVSGVASSKNSTGSNFDYQPAHAILKSSCSSTLYPDLCFSAISTVPDATSKIKTTKDVIDLSLNLTLSVVQQNYFKIQRLGFRRSLTVRQTTALHDCLEMLTETLDQLHKAHQELKDYPSFKKSLSVHADDLKILLSAAMTNQETCLDGFAHDKADNKVRQLLIAEELHVYHMSSNALAMIKNLTDTDMAKDQALLTHSSKRKLEEENETEWPEWLSAGDRRLLQAGTVPPNVTVAADGSGNYRTVSEAVAAAPSRSSRYVIRIKAGVYEENVDVPSSKTNIMFMGDGAKTTIITGSRSVGGGSTTFRSATVAAVGGGFLARDITFENTAGPSNGQAVALRVGSELSAFYRCSMIAYQDTLYVHSLRQFFSGCVIIGTIDFIFGNAAAVIQNCDIHARRPNERQRNMVTAQGRDDPNQNTGIVIQKCRIGATKDLQAVQESFRSYLGRPWRQYSRTIIMQTEISDVIDPAGWFEWDGEFALSTLSYREYKNTGPGADTTNRVKWEGFKVVTSETEVEPFTARNFIEGASWLPSTGFPYSLDL